jgi:hypothetical protein
VSDVHVTFVLDANVGYSLDGAYTALDAIGQYVHFFAYLYDNTSDAYVFNSDQSSLSTPNESFTLGLSGGDYNNDLIGSLPGTLVAGHGYDFTVHADIGDYDSHNVAAAASGFVNLIFVPEPTTALLLASGLLGLAARGRRRTA